MAEKVIESRIKNKHAPEADWKTNPNFKPLNAEIIVYDPDTTYDYPRMKIGDGEHTISELPFCGANDLQISATKPTFACNWFKVTSEENV